MTSEVLEEVRRLVPTVLYIETVGDYVGVTRNTIKNWLKRGGREAKRLRRRNAKPRPSEAIYLEFLMVYKKALAEGEIFDAGTIKKAAGKQWQAAAWRLERRFPDRWGLRDRRAFRELAEFIKALEKDVHAAQPKKKSRTPSPPARQ